MHKGRELLEMGVPSFGFRDVPGCIQYTELKQLHHEELVDSERLRAELSCLLNATQIMYKVGI